MKILNLILYNIKIALIFYKNKVKKTSFFLLLDNYLQVYELIVFILKFGSYYVQLHVFCKMLRIDDRSSFDSSL